jgi:hypothetical protein
MGDGTGITRSHDLFSHARAGPLLLHREQTSPLAQVGAYLKIPHFKYNYHIRMVLFGAGPPEADTRIARMFCLWN